MEKKLKITQIRSTINKLQHQRMTIRSLGLRKIGQSVVHDDTPAIRGMIVAVKHMVRVEEAT